MAHNDVPIGAVIVDAQGEIIGCGRNERELRGDPLAHAEIVALQAAATTRGSWRFDDCTLVVTLEPCAMCAGAMSQARLARVVFGAFDAKAGAVTSVFDVVRDPRLPHRLEVVAGIEELACVRVLKEFFAVARTENELPK
ncbi:DNA-binding protein inhibitor ID-3 [Platysternon megacephalum]|uniref:tRNA-specific adenosine deaminase 2 n=1 Tax=Platysternon megacephalum TaxID=55544 RepID=A0A4D9DDT6_9SAUR|nr:DNA-binding protein inhibitor ID-3 [Platysternon megacephalum]